MKAGVFIRYGSQNLFQITGVENAVPKDDEMLIRVRTSSVNLGDLHVMRGTLYFLRILAGLLKPRITRLGVFPRLCRN